MRRNDPANLRAPRGAAIPAVLLVLATAYAVLTIGCGGAGGGADLPTAAPKPVFTSLLVIPASVSICTVAPGNAVTLTTRAGDQSGQPMLGLGPPSFTNSDPSIVTVGTNGIVTALATGAAQVTAALTASGATRTAVATITVAAPTTGDAIGSIADNHPLPHIAAITAAQLAAGGALTLSIQGQAFHSHTLTLTDAQIKQVAGGCRTVQASSQDPHSDGSGSHTHTIAFN